MSKFTHLHTHSHYSLLDGLPKIDELISAAKRNGMDALALTDHGVMYGAIEFYKKAKAAGIKPIIGQEAYIAPYGYESKTRPEDKVRRHLVLLAKSEEGYQNLIYLTTKAHLEGYYYKPRIDRELLKKHAKGLIGLSGCLNGELAHLILQGKKDEALKTAREYEEIFGKGNFYLELQHHPKLKEQQKVNEALKEFSRLLTIPLVATADLHYLHLQDQHAQEVLVAINTNKELSDDARLSMKSCDLSFASPETMRERFKDVPEAVENTQRVAQLCDLAIELGTLKLPEFPLEKGKDANEVLRILCKKGAGQRYGGERDEVKKRLDYELSVIKKTAYAHYFLIVSDIVNWAKREGIVVGPGRGSAAGSLVSYVLNITNIDPLAYGLLFERFLNPERVSAPDIDIDFADARRDEVIAYTRKRYGQDHVAQIITFGTLASRGGVRDVGRTLGYPYAFCDRIAKLIPFGYSLQKTLDEISDFRKMYDIDPKVREVVDLSKKLEGVARHASTHACGVVIAPEPLTHYVPLQHASQDDRTIITQYEMHSVEDLGLLKMDFLGLKNLTIIEDALSVIKQQKGVQIDIDSIPLEDEKTFELLQKAQSTGVFQLESEGMKRYLKELKPTSLEDIIAMCALYRPGPMELIPSYIRRKHGKEPISYVHPIMKHALATTYGIIVYQEQVMDMATEFAGLTKGEGYLLIKAVGKKIKTLLDEQKEKFIQGCIRNKISRSIGQKTWELIEPFARYGFNKSHASGYALIAYQTAYLKANYPLEFMTALLNSRQGDIERLAFFIEEARAIGLEVLPPDINESLVNFTPVGEKRIRFGLKAIKNVGEPVVIAIIEERKKNGPFISVENLIERAGQPALNKKVLEALIKSGSLDALHDRKVLLENLDVILKFGQEARSLNNSLQGSLFAQSQRPRLALRDAPLVSSQERLAWERELLGLYISGNPLEKYRKLFEKKLLPAGEITERLANREVVIGGTIEAIKKITTRNGDPMIFMRVKDFTKTLEVTIFPSIIKETAYELKEGAIAIIQGKVELRQGALQLICRKIKTLS